MQMELYRIDHWYHLSLVNVSKTKNAQTEIEGRFRFVRKRLIY